MEIQYTVYPWKFGELFIAATSNGICRIDFSRTSTENDFVHQLSAMGDYHVQRNDQAFETLRSQLDRYFDGENTTFTEALDFLSGTNFQRQVWLRVGQIPYGKVRTYGEVAKEIDRPKAVRAVGAANGANPIPILVPCHRVVAVGGKLGGYSGGLDVKEYLLRLEGSII